jgi:predicted DNA-binding transcriptional regulator AlpA
MKNTLPETGFIRLPQVLQFIPFSKSTLWKKCSEGSFPRPVKLGPRTTAWRCEDVRRYIEDAAA